MMSNSDEFENFARKAHSQRLFKRKNTIQHQNSKKKNIDKDILSEDDLSTEVNTTTSNSTTPAIINSQVMDLNKNSLDSFHSSFNNNSI